MTAKHPLRIFMSYSRADRDTVKAVEAILKEFGHVPVWDRNVRPGHRFSVRIKEDIATAHLFMPIITKKSQKRPWVHQETGYAIGVEVPVLPLALEFRLRGTEATSVRAAMEFLRDTLGNPAVAVSQQDDKERTTAFDFSQADRQDLAFGTVLAAPHARSKVRPKRQPAPTHFQHPTSSIA